KAVGLSSILRVGGAYAIDPEAWQRSLLPVAARQMEFAGTLGGAAAVVCSRTRAAALPSDRSICNARVPRAIGQSFDWFVPAEAEVLGARVVDRPATFRLAELEQRTSASVVDRDVFSRRLRPPERHHQHLMLGEDVQARTLRAPSPWSLGARKPCGTPLLQLPADHILGPR